MRNRLFGVVRALFLSLFAISIFVLTISACGNKSKQPQAAIDDNMESDVSDQSSDQIFALLIPNNPSQDAINNLREFVNSKDGHILFENASTSLLIKADEPLVQEIESKFDCKVFTRPIDDVQATVNTFPITFREQVKLSINSWNYTLDALTKGNQASPEPKGKPLVNDAFISPVKTKATTGAMMGSMGVYLLTPESDGSIDANTETWSQSRWNNVYNEVSAALTWWASHASSNGKSLNFTIYYYAYNSPYLKTGYEPITHASYNECLWINQVMSNLGYTGGNCHTRVDNFNTYYKSYYGKTSFFTIFVVDSNNDSDGTFTDGYFGYAYLGGPFVVMTYDNDGWGISNMDSVAAHETGHIFHACDEYYSPGYATCSCNCSGNPWMTANNNCEDPYGCGADTTCIMRDGSSKVTCYWTKGQIGWYTPVELDEFNAEGKDGFVELLWSTSEESYNAGWNLYRAPTEDGEFAKINDTLIAPYQYSYKYTDSDVTNGSIYYYKLEDVNLDGFTTLHGPVSATPNEGADYEAGGLKESDDDSSSPKGNGSTGCGGF